MRISPLPFFNRSASVGLAQSGIGWRGLVGIFLFFALISQSVAGESSIRILSPEFQSRPGSSLDSAESVLIPREAVNQEQPSKAPASRIAPSELSRLLQEGHSLELENRWGEALSYYEKALRVNPQEPGLRRRFKNSRIHFDLRRRYRDQSFLQGLNQFTPQQALAIYDEVLLKIQTYHVDFPHFRELIENGWNHFDAALSTKPFCESNLPDVDQEKIRSWRHAVRRDLGQKVITNRSEATQVVGWIADRANRELGISPVATVMEFCCGAANSLDPYSALLTPNQFRDACSLVAGNFVGLGVELKMDSRQLMIVRVISGSPAEKAGILKNDQILSVDGQSVLSMPNDKAASLLQGKEGTEVALVVKAPNAQPREVRAIRMRVEVPSVDRVQIIDPDQGIGYLQLAGFQKTTSYELDVALRELHHAGMRKSLIVDLRGNPGGLLSMAVEVADRFVESGLIVSTRGRSNGEGLQFSARPGGTWHVPLVLLIDDESASAAEILAGAIRDHHRGVLIGTRSYGKGSVQVMLPLAGWDAGMRLTTSKFYSPDGHPFSMVGVQPDILVHQVSKPVDGQVVLNRQSQSDDQVLAAALEFARSKNGQSRYPTQR
jgi:carboxyl-terminal processing protease